MKYIFGIVLIIFVLLGCSNEKKEVKPLEAKNIFDFDTSDIQTTPVEKVNENYELSYKLAKNNSFKYRITSISEDIQNIKTPDTLLSNKIKQTMVYLVDLKINEIDNDGTIEAGCNISSLKLDINVNGNVTTYESGVTNDSIAKEKFAEYDALINNEFSIRTSKFGEISEIFRADKILNKYLEMKGLTDSVNIQDKENLKNNIADGVLMPLAVQIFRQLPKKPISIDSSWKFDQPKTKMMVFDVQNTTTYKMKSLEKLNGEKLAVVDAGLISKFSGKSKVSDRGVSYDFKKPETYGEGKIYFNLDKNVIQRSKTSTKLKISFAMEMQTPQGKQKGTKGEEITNTNILELL